MHRDMNVNKTGEIRIKLVDCVNVSFLIGMLHIRRARRQHRGKLAEGCMGSMIHRRAVQKDLIDPDNHDGV